MLMLCLQVSSTLLEALQLNSVQQEQRWRQQGKAEGGEIALKSRGSGVGSAAAAGVATKYVCVEKGAERQAVKQA